MMGSATDSAAAQRGTGPRSMTEDRELAILRAAYELLADVGYEALRLDAVASRAKASKATIYRHWAGKAELVAEAVRACAEVETNIPDTGSLRGDLLASIGNMARSIAGHDGPVFAALIMAMRNDPDFAQQMRAMRVSKKPLVDAILDRAQARGELKPRYDANLLEEIAPALIFMHVYALGEPMDDAFVQHLVDDIMLPLLTPCGCQQ
jgi:AcrR family transcriptional regulator